MSSPSVRARRAWNKDAAAGMQPNWNVGRTDQRNGACLAPRQDPVRYRASGSRRRLRCHEMPAVQRKRVMLRAGAGSNIEAHIPPRDKRLPSCHGESERQREGLPRRCATRVRNDIAARTRHAQCRDQAAQRGRHTLRAARAVPHRRRLLKCSARPARSERFVREPYLRDVAASRR